MSTVKEIFDRVKAAFNMPVAPVAPVAPVVAAPLAVDPNAPAAGTAQTYKLQDGTEISIAIKDPATNAEPSMGDMVTIAGNPAPAADYVLEDGTTITVDATGAIATITEAPTAAEPIPAPETDLAARVATLEAELERMRQPVTQLAEVTALQAASQKQDEVIKGLFELVEELVKEPTAEPKTLTEAQKQKFNKATAKEEKFNNILSAIKKK